MWETPFRFQFGWLKPSTGLFGLLLLAAGVASFGPGASNALAETTPIASQQHVRELEERVKILELERETLDHRMRLEAERTRRTIEALDMRIRLLEEIGRVPAEFPTAQYDPLVP